ncbi:hypothetical protein ScPMuIL_018248 [Solemya velum]
MLVTAVRRVSLCGSTTTKWKTFIPLHASRVTGNNKLNNDVGLVDHGGACIGQACLTVGGRSSPICQERHCHTNSRKNTTYFVTSPVFYVNAAPHIGHLYTTLLADAVSRWYRLLEYDVLYSTGTDEHGLKIQQAASLAGQHPLSYSKSVSNKFKAVFDQANIAYTDYVRTTEERHRTVVQKLWTDIEKNGYIYKGSYSGWYCVSDEAFLSNDEIKEVVGSDGNPAMVSIFTFLNKPVTWMKEENYMFRLSAFSDLLNKWLDNKVIQPDIFETLVRGWVSDLPDLSVSRQADRLSWGIPVPGDPSQTIYVWLDALANYLTVSGYPQENFVWPANCHVVGKDILRFHAVYWPAFLMAAGLDPPKQILCHSHWTVDSRKMSKSRGNVVDPVDRMNQFSADGLRFFLLREGVPHSDGNYSDQKAVDCINSELVNTLGNLLSRVTSVALNPSQVFPQADTASFTNHFSGVEREEFQQLYSLWSKVDVHYRSFNIYRGIEDIISRLRWANGLMQTHKPWTLVKSEQHSEHLNSVLHVVMETLRVCAVLLKPVVPDMSDRAMDRLGIPKQQRLVRDTKKPLSQYSDTALGQSESILLKRIKS